jgi:hypothetical protein
MPPIRSALAAASVAALLALAPAGLARAEGSVPSEVAAYVTDGSLVAQLNDVYGVDAAGNGIDFDDTTKTGVIERVHVFSAALRAGEETDHPLDLLNEWIVPVTIADAPVGVATVWINPATVAPELAVFDADADLATALSAVPDGSSLIREAESAAWLALAADGTLTPLVPGSTGLSTPVPIDDIAILPADPGPAAPGGDPNTGLGLAIAVVVFLFAVIVVALVVPTLRGRTKADAAAEGKGTQEVPAEPRAAIEPPADESAPAEEPPAPAKKPRATKKVPARAAEDAPAEKA